MSKGMSTSQDKVEFGAILLPARSVLLPIPLNSCCGTRVLLTLVVQGQLSGKPQQRVQLWLQLKTGIWKMAEVCQGQGLGVGV